MFDRSITTKSPKIIRGIVLALTILLICTTVFSCGSSDNITGKWYNENGKCLDIRSDGTYKLENEYGTGKWRSLGEGNFEFSDFYGDTQEAFLKTDENGEYIEFKPKALGKSGKYYKNKYPSDSNLSVNNSQMNNTTDYKRNDNQTTNKQEIDPFDKVEYTVSGISPYCKITINNSSYSSDIQNCIIYKTNKEYYSNNEIAVITASIIDSFSTNNNEKYSLVKTESNYTVSGQPEYITSINNIDLRALEKELSDTVTAEQAKGSGGDEIFGVYHTYFGTNYKKCNTTTRCSEYFLSLKGIKQTDFSTYNQKELPFNQLAFIYQIDFTWENTNRRESGDASFWVNISAGNIVKYPDGSIKWGYTSAESYDFGFDYSLIGMEECITTSVISKSDNYNISKVDTH